MCWWESTFESHWPVHQRFPLTKPVDTCGLAGAVFAQLQEAQSARQHGGERMARCLRFLLSVQQAAGDTVLPQLAAAERDVARLAQEPSGQLRIAGQPAPAEWQAAP